MKKQISTAALVMVGLLSLSGCSKKETPYEVAEIYSDLRNQVLTLDPNAIKIRHAEAFPNVWGVVMETGYAQAVSTLIALGDGTVSLYFSNGGGIIGVGQHEQPRLAAIELFQLAQGFVEEMNTTTEFSLPRQSHTRFYLLTFAGVLSVEEKEDTLGSGRHALSPLFFQAHELITQARIADETARGEPDGSSETDP
jgi:hypothetical protein